MARFRCGACGREGEFAYDPQHHECPRCGSFDVVFALNIDELPDEFVQMLLQAETLHNEKSED
ncbi:transposase [Bradyrhizobium japonicum]